MAFRTIVISNDTSLSLKNNNLVLFNGEEFKIPIEDISVLLLENANIRLTNKLLVSLSYNNVLTIVCNEKHLPTTLIVPNNNYYRPLKTLNLQIQQSEPFKKRIWQKIISTKLHNQGYALNLFNVAGGKYLETLANAVEVKTADKNVYKYSQIYLKNV